MKNNFKKIPFILSIVFFLLLSGVFFFIYTQTNANNEKANLSNVDFKNAIAERNRIKVLNNSIKSIKDDSALLGTHFAKSSDVVPFLDTIEGLAPKVGAKAETTSVDVTKDNTGLIVKMNVSGSFKSIYKFINLLENSPYELEFTNVDMQKEAEGAVVVDPTVSIDPTAPVTPTPIKESKWQAILGIKLLTFIP